MFDFSNWLDLPLIWGFIIAFTVFLYVVLDGFDLGCGILFPFAPSNQCRDKIMNSIAPFWDGNETWLVMGAGGLFVAFPLAYSILLPAFYIPILLMLIGLIFRGVAFEFRFKADSEKEQKLWDRAFHAGSILATFMQGVILGNFIQGVEVNGRNFSGSALDFANGFSIVTGIALIFGYALLGATWLIMKTDNSTQKWARKSAIYVLAYIAIFMSIVTVTTAFIDERIFKLWFSLPNFIYLLPIPLTSLIVFLILWQDLHSKKEIAPFFLSLSLFFLCYLGFGISLFPWIVPFKFTLWQAAATSTSQSLMLVGVVILLPLILAYTFYSYFVFRGKSSHEKLY